MDGRSHDDRASGGAAVPDDGVPDDGVTDGAVADDAVPDDAVPDDGVSDGGVPEPADATGPDDLGTLDDLGGPDALVPSAGLEMPDDADLPVDAPDADDQPAGVGPSEPETDPAVQDELAAETRALSIVDVSVLEAAPAPAPEPEPGTPLDHETVLTLDTPADAGTELEQEVEPDAEIDPRPEPDVETAAVVVPEPVADPVLVPAPWDERPHEADRAVPDPVEPTTTGGRDAPTDVMQPVPAGPDAGTEEPSAPAEPVVFADRDAYPAPDVVPVTDPDEDPDEEPDAGVPGPADVADVPADADGREPEVGPRDDEEPRAGATETNGWVILGRALRPRLTRAQLLAAVLCAVLGFALVVQVRQTGGASLEGMRQADLVRILDETTTRGDALAREAADLQRERDGLVSGSDTRQAAIDAAERNAATQGILTGRLPAEGPGVTVTLTELDGAVKPTTLLSILEEMRNAGAEAIELNGQRITASSAFTGRPGAVDVDGVTIHAPYVWIAIGDPDTVGPALNIPGGALAQVRGDGGVGTVESQDLVQVTAVRAVPDPVYATPVPPSTD